MSDATRKDDQPETADESERVELQLPPVEEALEAGTSVTIITPTELEMAIIVRDATVKFLALPLEEQTGDKMLALTVEEAAAHGYPDVEASLDHLPTEADVHELNAYIAEVEAQQAAQSGTDTPAE